jgi:hypothetical protein
MTIYSYILVRKDLNPSVQTVQASHAAMEMGFRREPSEDPVHLVVLGVQDQVELQYYGGELSRNGIPFEMFNEPDYNTGDTALCTYPKRGKINMLSNLTLL